MDAPKFVKRLVGLVASMAEFLVCWSSQGLAVIMASYVTVTGWIVRTNPSHSVSIRTSIDGFVLSKYGGLLAD
jgi:hypothetical protein